MPKANDSDNYLRALMRGEPGALPRTAKDKKLVLWLLESGSTDKALPIQERAAYRGALESVKLIFEEER